MKAFLFNMNRIASGLISVALISCGDDPVIDESNGGAPTTVQFETGMLEIFENQGEHTVRLKLDRPSPVDAVISLKTGTQFFQNFTSTPPVSEGYIEVPLPKGEISGEIKLDPIDNNARDGQRLVGLELHNLTGGFITGENNTIAITVKDDESFSGQESVANFIPQEITLQETNTDGVDYRIHFSEAVAVNSEIRIALVSEKGAYGADFMSSPAAENNIVTIPVVAGSKVVSFKITPVNNLYITGELKINMAISETGASIRKGNILQQTLTIKDDELAGKPKGYEVTAGNIVLKKFYEYDNQGRIAKVNWENHTPYLTEGTDTYFYGATGQIERINKSPGGDVTYRWENGHIIKSEEKRNGLIQRYVDYEYDDQGRVGLATQYYRQNDGTYFKGMYTVYLYFTDGNIFKSLTYQDNVDPNQEPYLLFTRTYDNYLDVPNPFDMVELLPTMKMQTKLATTYRVEEGGFDHLYHMTYEFRDDGLPEKRIATAPGDTQTSVYFYY